MRAYGLSVACCWRSDPAVGRTRSWCTSSTSYRKCSPGSVDLISRQGVPHKHILTWTPSGTDTLSFLDGGDGNSIGLFECLFFSLPSPIKQNTKTLIKYTKYAKQYYEVIM